MSTEAITDTPIEVVTRADVAAAEREAETAEQHAAELVHKVESGSDDVTLEEIEAAQKTSVFARLRAKGVQAKAERYRVAARVQRMKDLAAEILDRAPKSGDALVDALKSVEDAAREFVRLATEHDEQVIEWRRRISEFKIPQGTSEHGITEFGTVRVAGIPIELVVPRTKLAGLFTGDDYNISVRPVGDDRITATYRALDSIGEAL